MVAKLRLVETFRKAAGIHTRPIQTRYFHVPNHRGEGPADRNARSSTVDNALCAIVRKMLADERIKQADVYDLRGFMCKRVTRTPTSVVIKTVF